jgi:hypothetical protein
MRNALNIFMVILIIQLFYAVSINIIAYSLPSVTNEYIDQANSISGQVDIQDVTNRMENSFGNQLNIPVIELGALVFYSGNFLVDLLLNFLTALPQLISLVLYIIFNIVGADAQIIYFIQLFLTGIVTIYYFMSLITLLTNIRGRGSII